MRFDRSWLDLNDEEFRVKVTQWFELMKKPVITGGYRTATRKEHVQQAIDMVADYARYKEGNTISETDYTRNPKWNAITGPHFAVFKEPAPQPSMSIPDRIKLRNLWAEKRIMLETKLELMAYLASEKSKGFLQGDPVDVDHTLSAILEDAQQRCELTLDSWGRVSWRGIRVEKKVEVTNEKFKKAIKGEFDLEAGIRDTGKLEIEWKSIKGTFKYDVFAGVKATGSGEASIDRTGLKAEIEGNIELGFKLDANATIDTDYVVVGGELNAFVGALAKANAKLEIGKGGISLEAAASAFAGVKASTKGRCMIKWKGREVFGGEAEFSVSAGVGADASFALSIPIKGPSKFTISASTTIGFGMGTTTSVLVNAGNIKLSGEQFLYEDLRQFLVPREKRYKIDLTLGDRANQQLYDKVKSHLQRMLEEVKKQEALVQNELTQSLAK